MNKTLHKFLTWTPIVVVIAGALLLALGATHATYGAWGVVGVVGALLFIFWFVWTIDQ